MGTVYAEIILKNVGDIVKVKEALPGGQNIREASVNAVVDTGAVTLVISEGVREKLGLEVLEIKEATLANNDKVICKVVEPVEIHWKKRSSVCRPWVIPGTEEILLGAIPLEDMDLMVDPRKQELSGRHGDEAVGMLYSVTRKKRPARVCSPAPARTSVTIEL